MTTRPKLEGGKSVTDGFIHRFLEGIGTPRALTVWLLYTSEEHEQLVDLDHRFDVEPFLGLRSAYDASLDYIATEFLSKADFLTLNRDPEAVSMEKFLDSERSCRVWNHNFNKLDSETGSLSATTRTLISRAREKISDLLGEIDPQEFIDKVNWGPGATVKLNRSLRLAYDKFRLEDGMSPSCASFWSQPLWDAAFPRWPMKVSPSVAKIHSVPKNSKTNRTIIIEPGLNTLFQKGIGLMIRRRLAKVGIRLSTQADVHARLVPKIARSGVLATVDFSSASDTICRELVRELLPPRWYRFLDIHRSRDVSLLDGSILTLEKFSSMGNGFTFELQTVIFWALARSICHNSEFVSVFGDDVILPSSRLEQYQELCQNVGLTVNGRKSFSNGYFRESCGAHSFNGIDAKPLYLRSRIRSILDIFRSANQVRRIAHRLHSNYACDARFARAWRYLTGASVSRRFHIDVRKFYIPDGYGDFGLCVDFDEAAPGVKTRVRGENYQRGFYISMLVPHFVKTRLVEDDAVMLWKLFALANSSTASGWEGSTPSWSFSLADVAISEMVLSGNEIPDLKSPIRLRRSQTYVPEWKNLGPWQLP